MVSFPGLPGRSSGICLPRVLLHSVGLEPGGDVGRGLTTQAGGVGGRQRTRRPAATEPGGARGGSRNRERGRRWAAGRRRRCPPECAVLRDGPGPGPAAHAVAKHVVALCKFLARARYARSSPWSPPETPYPLLPCGVLGPATVPSRLYPAAKPLLTLFPMEPGQAFPPSVQMVCFPLCNWERKDLGPGVGRPVMALVLPLCALGKSLASLTFRLLICKRGGW